MARMAAQAAQISSLKDVPTRLKIGTVTSDHKIFMTLGSATLTQNDVIVIDFSSATSDFTSSAANTWVAANFAVTLNATSMDNAGTVTGGTAANILNVTSATGGTLSYNCSATTATDVSIGVTMTATTLVDPKIGIKLCGATPTAGANIVVWIKSGSAADGGNSGGNATIQNSTAGSQKITVKARNTEASPTDTGYYALGIVADDQVSLGSTAVDPSITFHAGAVAAATACSTTPRPH